MQGLSFRLDVDAFASDDLVVQRFRGREALNELYSFDLLVRSGLSEDELVRALGRDAHFRIEDASDRRVVHGVVASVRHEEQHRDRDQRWSLYRVELVPRAWLMSLRKVSRIFQGKRVDQVVREVLELHGIPSRWLLERPLPRSLYCTQYEETDLQFVTRLLAEHGLHFHFEQPVNAASVAAAGIAEAVGTALTTGVHGIGGAETALRDSTVGVFGWLGRLREIVVVADSQLFYPALPRPGEMDWGERLAQLAREQGAQALNAVSNAATQAANQADARLGAGVGEALGVASSSLLAALAETSSRDLYYRPDSGAMNASRTDTVLELHAKRRVHSLAATFRLYDPERPQAMLEAHERDRGELADLIGDLLDGNVDPSTMATEGLALAGELAGRVGGVAGDAVAQAADMAGAIGGNLRSSSSSEIYEHHSPFLHANWDYAKHEPRRMLTAAKRRGRVADGSSICPFLTAGHRFHLVDHPLPSLQNEQVVVELHHEGTISASQDERVYNNRFSCVPADVHYVPERPERRAVQVLQTAIVVGSTDIETNDHGEVCVRFHWDRRRHASAHTTCWLRTMQTWAGGGYGSQFIPRVGMEVVVAFDGGDPDRPLVLGCVYNAVAPPPFQLPQQKTVSGIRTHSSPNGDGSNELWFDDAAGAERVHIKAQRDLETVVGRERRTDIVEHDRTEVRGDQHLIVRGTMHHDLSQRDVRVSGDDRHRVEGTRYDDSQGDAHIGVNGDRSVRVRGAEQREIAGRSQVVVKSDSIHRVEGNAIELVGTHDRPRTATTHVEGSIETSATQRITLEAEQEILLVCGKSYLRLTPERAVLGSKEVILQGEGARQRLVDSCAMTQADDQAQIVANQVLIKSHGAGVALGSEAAIDGSKVLLNSPTQASDELESTDSEPTIIELKDQNDQPIANQPFTITLDGGGEVGGMLDENGRAEIALESGGEIGFPGLRGLRRA